jgi:hypothetical protein
VFEFDLYQTRGRITVMDMTEKRDPKRRRDDNFEDDDEATGNLY